MIGRARPWRVRLGRLAVRIEDATGEAIFLVGRTSDSEANARRIVALANGAPQASIEQIVNARFAEILQAAFSKVRV